MKSKFSVGHSLAHITLNPRNARGHVRLKNHLPHAVEMDFITFGCSGAGLDCYRPPAFSIALIIIFLVFGQISPPPKMVRLCPRSDDFKCRRTAPIDVSAMNQRFLFSVSSARPYGDVLFPCLCHVDHNNMVKRTSKHYDRYRSQTL